MQLKEELVRLSEEFALNTYKKWESENRDVIDRIITMLKERAALGYYNCDNIVVTYNDRDFVYFLKFFTDNGLEVFEDMDYKDVETKTHVVNICWNK